MKPSFFLLSLLAFCLSCSSKKKADLIIYHAKIYTVNKNFETATVLVIKDGKIEEIGGDSLLNQYTATQIIDAKGKYLYPGFIDAHCHFTGQALDAYKLKLFSTKSFEEVIEKVVAFSKTNKREWLEGTGWDQNDWPKKTFPVKDTLDKLFPNTPVFLLRVDGHAVLLNQKALDIANINLQTKISGGEIEVKNGKLTGILIDNAINLVKEKLPLPSQKESEDFIIQAQQQFFDVGLTSIIEPGVKKVIIDLLKEAFNKEKLRLRVTLMLNADTENMASILLSKPYETEWLHVAGFKIFADGSLGSRGAFLLHEYADRHQHVGGLLLSIDSLQNIVNLVASSPYQLCTHAIGDAANRTILEMYSKMLPKQNDRRWRIEHAQVVDKNDIHLFSEYSIIPSVQPTHATSDMSWAAERLGNERMNEAYAYKTLLQQNGWMPLGTDFPVESLNPLNTFCAAVFRQDKNGLPTTGFQTENALTREEALQGMTIWAAKSVFEEKKKGSLEKGKFADFVILDTDLMKASAKEIYNAKVIVTYVNGVKMTK